MDSIIQKLIEAALPVVVPMLEKQGWNAAPDLYKRIAITTIAPYQTEARHLLSKTVQTWDDNAFDALMKSMQQYCSDIGKPSLMTDLDEFVKIAV
jgi:hypothetical protein